MPKEIQVACPYLGHMWRQVRERERTRNLEDTDVVAIWEYRYREALRRGVGSMDITHLRLDNPFLTEEALQLLYGLRERAKTG